MTATIHEFPSTPAARAQQQKINAITAQIAAITADVNLSDNRKAQKLAELEEKLANAEIKLAKLERLEQRATPQERATERNDLKAIIRGLLADFDIYWVTNQDRFMHYCNGEWQPIKKAALYTKFHQLTDRDFYAVFDDVLEEDNRKFDMATFSWRPTPANTLNMLRATDICAPVNDGQRHHWFFDTLVLSLGGGNSESAEHIEQWVALKYIRPMNFMHPALVIQDDGQTGKSLFGEVLMSTIYGSGLTATNVAMKDYIGNFTLHTAGRAFVHVNESVADKVDDNALKRALHSRNRWCEGKFLNSIRVETTEAVMITGNEDTGAVRVASNRTDRRLSIVKADKPLNHYVSKQLGCSLDEATVAIEGDEQQRDGLQHLLSDPLEVGRWLHYIIERWKHIPKLFGFHGADYRSLCEIQKKFHVEIFEDIFTQPIDYIKRKTLYGLYVHSNKVNNNGYGALKRNTFYEVCRKWLDENKLGWHVETVRWGGHDNKADVFIRTDFAAIQPRASLDARITLADNDGRFVGEEGGRSVWKHVV